MSNEMELFGGHKLRRVWMEGQGEGGEDMITSQKMAAAFMIRNASSIRLISTSSLEGFIFVIHVKDANYCPFETVRDMDLLGTPGVTSEVVKSILLKVGLVRPGNAPIMGIDIPRAGNPYDGDSNFQVSNEERVELEIRTQRELYKRTLIETVTRENDHLQRSGAILFEPVCPNLLAVFNNTQAGLDRNTYMALIELIRRPGALKERPFVPSGDPDFHEANDRDAINHLLTANFNKYIIAMEFFDNAVTLHDQIAAKPPAYEQYYRRAHQYQLLRMRNSIGRIHTDAHLRNALYIPERTRPSTMFQRRQRMSRERIVIIDFGNTEEFIHPTPAAAAPAAALAAAPVAAPAQQWALMANLRRIMNRPPATPPPAAPLLPPPPAPVGRCGGIVIEPPDEDTILEYEQGSFERSQLFIRALLDMPEYNQDIGIMIFGIMLGASNFSSLEATEIAESVFAIYEGDHGPRGEPEMRRGLNVMRRAEANAPGLARSLAARALDAAQARHGEIEAVLEILGWAAAAYGFARGLGVVPGGGLVGGSNETDSDLSEFIELLGDSIKTDKRMAMKLLAGLMGVDVNLESTGVKTELSNRVLLNIAYTFLSAASHMDVNSQSIKIAVNKKKSTRRVKLPSQSKSMRRRAKSPSQSKSMRRRAKSPGRSNSVHRRESDQTQISKN
jgi:hypothetical protein